MLIINGKLYKVSVDDLCTSICYKQRKCHICPFNSAIDDICMEGTMSDDKKIKKINQFFGTDIINVDSDPFKDDWTDFQQAVDDIIVNKLETDYAIVKAYIEGGRTW